jgi:4-amino-4-deoxy-L-arabinose transferase-like glycosyltransferase
MAPPSRAATSRAFVWGLVAVAAVAFGVRLAYILVERSGTGLNPALGVVGGDAFFYQKGAWLLPDHGFVSPEIFLSTGRVVQSAEHPPMYLLWLGLPSVFGIVSPVADMVWSALLGTGTIVLVGLLGRKVRDEKTGIVAAALAAVYPNVWSHDGFLTSETMAIFTVTLTLLLAYRYWEHPTVGRGVALGFACALATLSRAELGLLFVLVVLPLVVRSRPDGASRWRVLAAAAIAGVIPIGAWVGFNISRFDDPVYLSTGFGVTLASANCDFTYHAPYTGYWNMQCAQRIRDRDITPDMDQSEQDPVFRRQALEYAGDHLDRVPSVLLARWGRISSLWLPWQQASLDHFPEGRETWVANSSLVMWFTLLPLAVAGVFVLRSRRVPVFPLLALPVTVWVAITLTFATTRYRATMETVLCVLAACAIAALIDATRAPRARELDVTADGADVVAVPATTR